MEEEWIKFLRENHPDLYEQMKKSVRWQYEWRDNKLTAKAELIDSLQVSLAESEARVAGLLVEVKRLREGIKAVEGLINDSQGVYGLHLNGDPAPWATLRTGGYFEEWLLKFDDALAGGAE